MLGASTGAMGEGSSSLAEDSSHTLDAARARRGGRGKRGAKGRDIRLADRVAAQPHVKAGNVMEMVGAGKSWGGVVGGGEVDRSGDGGRGL